MAGFEHESVLTDEVIDDLALRDHGVYVDGTLGGAGHAAALLGGEPDPTLIGIDRDPAALDAAPRAPGRLRRPGDGSSTASTATSPRSSPTWASPRSTASCSTSACRRRSSTSPSAASRSPGPVRSTCGWIRPGARPRSTSSAPLDVDDARRPPLRARRGAPRQEDRAADQGGAPRRSDRTPPSISPTVVARRSRSSSSASRRSTRRPAPSRRCGSPSTPSSISSSASSPPSPICSRPAAAARSSASTRSRIAWSSTGSAIWRGRPRCRRHLAERRRARRRRSATLVTRKAIVATDDEIARNPRARSARLRVCERTSAPNLPARFGSPAM